MRLIRCIALVAFTQFVPGYGQVHGDPDSSDEDAQFPMVPETVVEMLVEANRIETPEEEVAAFKIEPVPIGRYRITGPGIPENTIIRGKEAAERYLAEAKAKVGADDMHEGGAPL